MNRATLQLPVTLCAALLFLASCASTRPDGVPKSYTPAEVPAAVAEARADLEAGRSDAALWRMRIAQGTSGLDGDVRASVQNVLERSAEAHMGTLSQDPDNAEALKDMLELDLPRQLAVSAGIRAAELYFAQGERMRAFRLVRSVDLKYPHHHERPRAGRLLAAIGFDLAQDHGRYGLFFHFDGLAPQVLEYLVLNYPSEPKGAEAYWTLAQIYEDSGEWLFAIEKHEDLTLWHPGSDYVAASEARIPHLRLVGLTSPEYDRSELLKTRAELEKWLANHPRHDLLEEVQLDLTDCIQRLADNDLTVARFYQRVNNPTGAEYHARRAVDEALDGADERQKAEAEELLREVLAEALETAQMDAAAAVPEGAGP